MPCGEAPAARIFGLALQDFAGDAEVESPLGLLRLGDHVGLEGREVVGQLGHGGGEPAGQPQLAGHEVDRVGQLGRRQDLLADGPQQVLRRHALLHPLPQRAEEVGLLDVFLAGQAAW